MNANEIETDFDIFKSKIKTNINSLFLDFKVLFPNFDLKSFYLFIYSYFSSELDKDFTHEFNSLRPNTAPGRYKFVNVGKIIE